MQAYTLITDYYGEGNLAERITHALQSQGKSIEEVAPEDLSFFDEFHIGGKHTTVLLAKDVGIEPGSRVLDVGCGVGGPARTLAKQFNCRVMGLDVTEEYCATGRWLSNKVGLGEAISFLRASALEIPIEDDSFDLIWMQHVTMNLEDKERLFEEAFRVLKPGGKLGLHEVLAGPVFPVYYPLGWAPDESVSFLLEPRAFKEPILSSGFVARSWLDVTEEFLRIVGKSKGQSQKPSKPPPGLAVLVPKDALSKARNTIQNLLEKRIVVVRAVFQKPAHGK
jgi:ubiquinone/menaquinone biosynthesis C-methylase UbiE